MITGAKVMVAFAAGIGCGVLATYTYFSDKYKKIADEEIAAMESIFKSERKKETEKAKEKDESWVNPVINMEKRTNELTNYAQMTESYISSVPPAENEIEKRIEKMHNDMEELAEKEHPKEEEGEQYEITYMDWLDDPTYDKVTLTYFVGDDTIADEVGHVDDVGMSIGFELFELFKENESMETFVRNPALGIDYNVVKDMGCYHA